MNPLYIFLERLTKRLEQEADLWVVNKLLVVYFVNILGIIVHLCYGILALRANSILLAVIMFSTLLVLIMILGILYFLKNQKVAKLLMTIIYISVSLYLLYSGGTSGS